MDQLPAKYDPGRRAFLTTGLALAALPATALADGKEANLIFEPVKIPDWVHRVTRMAFLTPGEVDKAARADVQVVHGNAVWPYYPLRKDGGGLPSVEARLLRKFVEDCHRHHMKLVLGLPPFPAVELVKKHPEWRVHANNSDAILKVAPDKDKLGTRLGCNLGPWGDYLIEVCAELVRDYGVAVIPLTATIIRPCAFVRRASRRISRTNIANCPPAPTWMILPIVSILCGAANAWNSTTAACRSGSRRSTPMPCSCRGP
jgi:hypothetical protein